MTGASLKDWSMNGVPDSVFLQKPFQPRELVNALSGLLTKVRPHPGEEVIVQGAIATSAQA